MILFPLFLEHLQVTKSSLHFCELFVILRAPLLRVFDSRMVTGVT